MTGRSFTAAEPTFPLTRLLSLSIIIFVVVVAVFVVFIFVVTFRVEAEFFPPLRFVVVPKFVEIEREIKRVRAIDEYDDRRNPGIIPRGKGTIRKRDWVRRRS